MREIQSQVNDLKKKIKASKPTKDHLSIEIPAPDQQEYYGIFQDIAVPSVIVSLSGIILDVNKLFRGALAKTRASLVGRSIFSVAHSSSLPLLYKWGWGFFFTLVRSVHFSRFLRLQRSNLLSSSGAADSCSLIQFVCLSTRLPQRTPLCFSSPLRRWSIRESSALLFP